jgi:hypothetical protein
LEITDALAAALQTAAGENGAADAAPEARKVTAAIANKKIMTLRMASPKSFALREAGIKYLTTLHVNAAAVHPSVVARTHQAGRPPAIACAAAAAAGSLA